MNNEIVQIPNENETVLNLVKKIKNGLLDPKQLSPDDRKECVFFLSQQGLHNQEIAELLRCSDRTIRRDRETIRDKNAIHVDADFTPKMAGELYHQAQCHISHLMKLARDKTLSGMERLMAETGAWKIKTDLFKCLQSIGFLPKVANQAVVDVIHHNDPDAVRSADELLKEIEEIESLETDGYSIDDEKRAELESMKLLLKQHFEEQEIAGRLNEMNKELRDNENGYESSKSKSTNTKNRKSNRKLSGGRRKR